MKRLLLLILVLSLAGSPCRARLLSKFDVPSGSRVGLAVGTFDPVTLGHDRMFEGSLRDAPIDYLVVVLNNETPWLKKNKPGVTSFAERLQMLIVAYGSHTKIVVADIPFTTPILAQAVRDHLKRKTKGNVTLSAVVGTDAALKYAEIPEDYFVRTDHLIVFQRPGYKVDLPASIRGIPVIRVAGSEYEPAVSATAVRHYLQTHPEFFEGGPLPATTVLPLLPAVAKYVRKTGIYRRKGTESP